jgi:predicted nucleic acid-binding protein
VRLFFDANVVFSAAHREEGRSQDLVALAQAGYCELVSSAHALEEARRNLVLKSRDFEERLAAVLAVTTVVAEAPATLVDWALGHGLPLKDAPILAAAIHAKATLLVTGDSRHFKDLYSREMHGTLIVTPASALQSVLKEAGF